ncbi:hypothetical protein EES43_21570 [Streptomyces sp. ADI96-02]|uniref:DUF3515 domain-containing protein n=1 Tax=unclassified Streptomyces TaxID=2593676 RepID=UPI000F55079C|nr:DUF3515 domain-containing protein [Streptomyces sp. ADI96-02]RPK57513.1 hypothetical protein EES43_21570 [Streptomyces sp. ADI96-02]
MTSSRRRPLRSTLLLGPSAAVLVLAAAGCSVGGASPVAVPTPSPEAAAYCEALHAELPETVVGLRRSDPSPDSELTSGWGDGAIVLRCGVPRPAKMDDPQAEAVEADGVSWMLEQPEGSGPRFTSTYRKAYVEVTLSEEYAHDATPLAALAGPVGRAVPDRL